MSNRQTAGTSTRRQFLGVLTGAAALSAAGEMQGAAETERSGRGWIDANVSLGPWPLRQLPNGEPETLVRKLRSRGVTQAWVGSLEALLHKDLSAVNARLANQCREQEREFLVPFGAVNPLQPDWAEELRRCVETHRLPGIRLHPNYHGYKLDDPSLARLLQRAAELQLVVQLALVMEDERMMHPLCRVEPVDTAPLARVVRGIPGLRLILLNALRTVRGPALKTLLEAGDVSVEISMLEGVAGVERLLADADGTRILFGSHAPLFYFESAELKLQESPLAPNQLEAIRFGNARRLLARGRAMDG